MKCKSLVLLTIPIMLLSSCTYSLFDTGTAKEIEVYDLDAIENGDDLANVTSTNIKARFLKNKEYVPYISLKQYASLYESRFAEEVNSYVKKESLYTVWYIYVGEEPYFIAVLDTLSQEFQVSGSISAALKPGDNPVDTSVLSYGLMSSETAKALGDRNYNVYSFDDIDVHHFSYGGEYYFPLTFYDLTFCDASSVYHYYNYNHVYSTYDVENYSKKEFVENNKRYTVDSQMKESNSGISMPKYLKQLNANMFFYVIDNFYGLKDLKGFTSMEKFMRSNKLYERLYSDDGHVRAQAYADAVSLFDDNHTAIVSANETWGEDKFVNFNFATVCISRAYLDAELKEIRNKQFQIDADYYRGARVSSDGETALFTFDSFVFGSSKDVFNENGSINYERAREVDSAYSLVDLFNYLRNTTVKNIVLDISTNGGGVVGVLFKILCLLSKTNIANFYYYESNCEVLGTITNRFDLNNNGVIDSQDCYGNVFNFYLLTSDCSFSCGNAFPCLAKEYGIAKIIGQKSGGGECAVGIHYLPNSQYVYHSSNLHLGYYDEATKIFTGFEGGAPVDIEIKDNQKLYDVNYLNQLIKNA